MMSRSNRRKQIAVNLISSIVSFVISFAINFFTVPFIVEKIGAEAYGFVGLARDFTQYAAILTAAFNSMASRFITVSLNRGEREDAEKYTSSVFAANLAVCIPLSVAGMLIILDLNQVVQVSPGLLPSVQILWCFIFGAFLLHLMTSVFSTAAFVKNRLELTSLISMVSTILRAAVLVIAFLLFTPLIWYVGLANSVQTVITALLSFFVFSKLMPEIRIRWKQVEFAKIRTLIASGIWNSLSQMCSIAMEQLDLLITNLFVSAPAMGMVSIAKSVPNNLLAFFVLFGNAFSPQITIDYARGQMEELKNEIVSAIRLVSFCSSIPLVCVYVFSREFFQLWVPAQDAGQLYVITVLACIEFPLVIPGEPLERIFVAANKTKQTAAVAVLTAVLSVVSTFVLLSFVETELQRMCVIVGVSSFLGLLRGAFFLPLYGAHCLKLKWYVFYPYLLRNLLGIFCGLLIAMGIRMLIPVSCWGSLILAVGVSAVVMVAVNAFLLLTGRERKILIDKIRRKNREHTDSA